MDQNFNPFEKKIALLLSGFPQIKSFLKKTYQLFNYLIYRKKYNYLCDCEIKPVEYKNYETFFGYYDKSPLNESGEFLLFHASSLDTKKKPHSDIPIKIILYDIKGQSVRSEQTSYAYNWQQGSRTQWIDNNRFIYNDYDTNRNIFYSKISDIEDLNVIKKIDFPVYDVKNNIALSLNFHRLTLLRPDYGYRNKLDKADFDITDLINDGIYRIDLEEETVDLLISLKDVAGTGKLKFDASALHKVNHIMINPTGNKFIFLHRYFISGRRYDRLFVSNIDGKNLELIADDDMVSHCFWSDDSNVLCFMRDFKHGDHYYKINMINKKREIFGGYELASLGDGHPSFHNNEMLYDTYPDKSRMKNLYIYDTVKNRNNVIGSFYESLKYSGETRCDLHPRWSPDGKNIFIDSVHTGKRQLYMLKRNYG